ncbi:hypothetical protein GCM10010211_51810 [Streptomyces albospinus]|uniref:Uncharacterized protein n=1 Tax=Streptomyces albospinus TaxID=285515 RepID=A0ABQ2VC51_9ACTN|nr:hypothetical protein GCM10010211_51810 [Streptomyces albospinus]
MIGEPGADLAGAVRKVAVQDEVHLAVEVACEPDEEAAHHAGTFPQLPGMLQVTGPVTQHGLPDRLLLDRSENLMFTDAPATRLGHKRRTASCQPRHPPVVHGLERDLEQHRDIPVAPARHQRGNTPHPKGLLRRRRQLPRIPHQFTHAEINDPENLPATGNRNHRSTAINLVRQK